jgi:hypothetical protein
LRPADAPHPRASLVQPVAVIVLTVVFAVAGAVVIGGLVSATLLTVLVLPVLYTIVLPERGHGRMPRLESAPLPEVA